MLRSLELYGFKSFADRTRFDFHPGITGVVGPNGSGKSNVVDAVKWILGVQSAKSLRGKSMTDVIFNGSAGRRPSAFAEATLTFDNSSGFLKIDAAEVQIGRRIMQGGDAEYLINHAPARLKDITRLLMGTGAGSTAYCIIEQGRVDQILEANASARRRVFEEAAGISRYKADKAEAERKLARVEQNVLRLSDIVDEVRVQLDALRGQATKAARYRDLSEQFREAWLGLAADDYRHLSAQLEQIEDELAKRDEHIAALSARQRELEARLAALDAEVSAVDDRLRDAERRAATTREAIAGRQVAARHESERMAELESEILRLRQQQVLMLSRSSEVAAEHDRVRRQLARCAAEHARLAEELAGGADSIAELSAAIAEGRARLAGDRQDLLHRTRQVSAAGSRVAALEAQSAAARREWEVAQHRREALEEELAAAAAEVDRRRAVCDESEAVVAEADNALQTIRDRRAAVCGELDAAQRTLAAERERRMAWQARLAVLEDLERRHEGIGIGVREILSRAETSHYSPWCHIRGSVADLLDVDLEHAALIEVALGARSQLIVLDDIGPLLDYLQSESCRISGRVGFVQYQRRVGCTHQLFARTGADEPVGAAHAADWPVDLSGREGVIDRADRLVRSPGDLPRLAEQLLADTWIVDTLATAVGLRAELAGDGSEWRTEVGDAPEVGGVLAEPGGRIVPSSFLCPSSSVPRFVTLQGELLDRDGTLIAGTIRSEAGVVSRKSELRRLKNDIARLERRIADGERRMEEIENSLAQVDQELAAARALAAETRESRRSAQSDLEDARRKLEWLEADRSALAEEVLRMEDRVARADESAEQARIELIREEDELSDFQEQLAQAERDLADDEQRLRALEDSHAAGQLELAKQEERLESLRDADARLEHEARQRAQQRDEAARRLEAALNRRSKSRLRILSVESELADLFLNAERSEVETRGLAEEKRRVRSRRAALREEEAALRDELRELHGKKHEGEMRARELRHRLETLAQRIEEEFQVSLVNVVASGASALARRLGRIAAAEDGQAPVDAPLPTPDAPDDAFFEQVRPELEAEVERLRRQLKALGSVNTDSLHDLDDLEYRYAALAAQLDDLRHAKSELEEIVRRINGECRKRFGETFAAIRGHFRDLFRKLFGGGEGDVILEDPDDPLECGIDIVARPPGKELRSISLLSGGERTLTAVALLMAIFRSNPSPFCILDEVDAALDEANVDRFMNLLREFRDTTQFIMITHKKPSMAMCDMLYGVTMEESGVSKRLSVRFEDVGENGELRNATRPSAAA